ncbi:hypothetical protein R5R35_002191 [Gryllus longicercus]|uniref:Hemopexin n=1 Tax=Gryllus longicercus TaxID=2509291 RepID=A0AAN9VQU7_9ORTH
MGRPALLLLLLLLALASRAAAPPPPPPELCQDPSVDAAFQAEDGQIYVFKGDVFFAVGGAGAGAGGPRRVAERWPAVARGGVDAAFALRGGRVYLFQGERFWRLGPDGRPDARPDAKRTYPRALQASFPGLPPRVDAAAFLPRAARLLFFSGSQFWEVWPLRSPPVGPPRNLSCWGTEAPPRVDAALVLDGRLHLLFGRQHVRLDERLCQVEAAEPPFPRDNARWLFGCAAGADGARARPPPPPSRSLVLSAPPPPPPPPPESPPPPLAAAPPALCASPLPPDAVLPAPGGGGAALFVRGALVWRVGGAAADEGAWPAPAAAIWPGLPPAQRLHAAFLAPDGAAVLIGGRSVWRFAPPPPAAPARAPWRPLPGFPRALALAYPGAPDHPDAALAWPGGKVFFFKGSLFWKFDPSQTPPVGPMYPNVLAQWAGIPSDGVDAAAVLNNRTFFFKGPRFYRFDDRAFAVEAATPPFPRSTALWLLRCPGAAMAPPPTQAAPPTTTTSTTTPSPSTAAPAPAPSAAPACPREAPPPPPAAPSQPPPAPAACGAQGPGAGADAVLGDGAGGALVVRGAWAWRVSAAGGVARGWPLPVARLWPGLPARVHAATRDAAGRALFFRDALVWRFAQAPGAPPDQRWRLERGFPRALCRDWPGAPAAPDAVLQWGARGHFYFFKGSLFWKFDPSQTPPVGPMYPNVLAQWAGIPSDGVDAAAVLNNRTFFFKGPRFYRFDDRAFALAVEDPPYPHSTADVWFGCGGGGGGIGGGGGGGGGGGARRRVRPVS